MLVLSSPTTMVTTQQLLQWGVAELRAAASSGATSFADDTTFFPGIFRVVVRGTEAALVAGVVGSGGANSTSPEQTSGSEAGSSGGNGRAVDPTVLDAAPAPGARSHLSASSATTSDSGHE